MTPNFELTKRQHEANQLLGGQQTHTLIRGGSRSGKTFLLCRAIAVRALRAANSTHAIFRFRFNHLKNSIIFDTWPKMMKLCFPEVEYHLNRTDWFIEFPNGSRVVFGGLDDKDRTEKILGQEYSTIYLNECSQIPYDSRNKAITRLAQNSGLKLRFYYDCNPPQKGHWTYRLFEEKMEPRSGMALTNPNNYATLLMNPADNAGNLPPEYLETLAALPEKDKLRFLHGLYGDAVDNALWTYDLLDKHRISQSQLPAFKRIVIGVDPSGCKGEDDYRSDEIGIIAAGLDFNDQGVILEDASGRFSPEGWAREAKRIYNKWQADTIVAETNFGGAMVESNIRTADRSLPIKLVTASRGKVQRAEPIASLYTQGRIKHLGAHPELED